MYGAMVGVGSLLQLYRQANKATRNGVHMAACRQQWHKANPPIKVRICSFSRPRIQEMPVGIQHKDNFPSVCFKNQ
jgi:hypothetical protein